MLLRPASVGALLALPFLFACNDSPSGPTFVTSADSAELTHFAGDHRAILLGELGDLNSQFPSTAGLSAPATPLERGRAADRYIRGLLATLARGGAPIPAAAFAASNAAPFSECVPTITGVDTSGMAIDTDDDGIPDDYKLDYGAGCVSADSAGTYRITQSGSLRIQDPDLGFFSFVVTLDHESTKIENLVTGEVTTLGVDGQEGATYRTDDATRVIFLTVNTSDLNDGVLVKQEQDFVRRAEFTPDSGMVLSLGTELPAGSLDYRAQDRAVNGFEGKNFSFDLVSTVPLHYVPACIHQFDAGTLHGTLDRISSVGFELHWLGCAEPTLTIFGNSEPPST